MNISIRISSFAAALFAVCAHATPPGTPLSEIKSRQLSLGVYFDHGGQQLFQEGSASVLNTTGAALEYGLLDFAAAGAFVGAAELDVDRPPGDSSQAVFNSGFGPYAGLTAKLSTPRFLVGTSRFVACGQAAYIHNKDADGNEKSGMVYNSGLTFQSEIHKRVNFVLGAEFYAIDGDQKVAQGGGKGPFGLNEAGGTVDHMRGVVGFEYFFKGPNRPFVSVAFRPTGSLGYKSGFGLQGGSLSVTLGAINSFGKQSDQPDEDSRSLSD